MVEARPGPGPPGRSGLCGAEPPLKELQVVFIDFEAHSLPAEIIGAEQGRPRPGKGVEDHFTRVCRKDLDAAPGQFQGKGCRVVQPRFRNGPAQVAPDADAVAGPSLSIQPVAALPAFADGISPPGDSIRTGAGINLPKGRSIFGIAILLLHDSIKILCIDN